VHLLTWRLSDPHHGLLAADDPGCGIDNGREVHGQPEELQMTVVRTRTVRQIAATLAVAISLTALASPSFAFTAEAQQQCTGDAFRLCSSEIPNIGRITACMVKNRSSLSLGCRVELDKGLTATSHKVAEQ
jgi:hypothetical protein